MRARTYGSGRGFSILVALIAVLTGCSESPQNKLDSANRDLERAQARLDNLRPAYDAAKITAANTVCKEIAGVTAEESATAALQGLGDVLNETNAGKVDDGKKNADGKQVADGKKTSDIDKTIDNLIAGEKKVQEKEAALTAPVAKANEVMRNMKTAGTPEAKRYAEVLAAMPEVKAYERQEKRVAEAQNELDDAEKEVK